MGMHTVTFFVPTHRTAPWVCVAAAQVKQKYGITDERAALWMAIDEWDAALQPAKASAAADGGGALGTFRGGALVPDWGDVAVRGRH